MAPILPAPATPSDVSDYLESQIPGHGLEWVWRGTPRYVEVDVNPDGTANIQAHALPAAAIAALLRSLPKPRG